MQESFLPQGSDLDRWHRRLTAAFEPAEARPHRTPVGQLVKSLISSRTRDAVSVAAYRRLGQRYRSAAALAEAAPAEVERLIADVTFAPDKAERLVAALRQVGAERRGHDLGFLGQLPIAEALAWLERLPGVGRKVAASTLNFSTLDRPVFVVDSHIVRVLARLGFVPASTSARIASELVTAALRDWSAERLRLLHIHMKRLGQTLCRWDVPACDDCPLRRDCRTGRAR